MTGPGIDEKLRRLHEYLADHSPMIISFSGGVDSGVMAAVARDELGDDALAVLLKSPVIPEREIESAIKIAESIGIGLEVLPVPLLEDPAFCSNPPDRCYLCKKHHAGVLSAYARDHGYSFIADGLNASDLGERRPGKRAGDEEGILHPFIAAGISKPEVREIARIMRLSFAEKLPFSCLCTRVPYGESISPDLLARIGRAEDVLGELGFTQFRVRAHGPVARVEVIPGEMEMAMEHRVWIVRRMKETGFIYVTLDLEGFRSGSMDEVF
nr:ATP-dependent sacrificial sulfur transferase LarE [Methanolinea mesophila]